MKRTIRHLLPIALTLLVGALASGAHAQTLIPGQPQNFTGAFTTDDQVGSFNFTLLDTRLVTLTTTSYAAGGFDPILTLFNSSGTLVAEDDDDDLGKGGLPAGSGDAFISTLLGPGNYTLALTEYDNFAIGPNLSDGFLQDGQGNFTAQFGGPGATGPFIGLDGSQRTGAFAVTVSASSAPEPGTLALAIPGLLTLTGLYRRRMKR